MLGRWSHRVIMLALVGGVDSAGGQVVDPARGVQPAARGVQPAARGVQPAAQGVQPAARGVQPAVQGVQPPLPPAPPAIRGQQPLGAPGTGEQDVFRGPTTAPASSPAARPTTSAPVSADGVLVPDRADRPRRVRFGLGRATSAGSSPVPLDATGIAATPADQREDSALTGRWAGPVLVFPSVISGPHGERYSSLGPNPCPIETGAPGDLAERQARAARRAEPAGPTPAGLSPEYQVLLWIFRNDPAAARDEAEAFRAAGISDAGIQRAVALSWALDGRLDRAWPELLAAYETDPSLAARPVPEGALPDTRAGEITGRSVALASGRPDPGRLLLLAVLMQYRGDTAAAARVIARAKAAGLSEPVAAAFERALAPRPAPSATAGSAAVPATTPAKP